MSTSQKSTQPFFPGYTDVGGLHVNRSSDVTISKSLDGYFADIQASIETMRGVVCICDLRNALIPGKLCECVTVSRDGLPNCLGFKTYRDLYEEFFVKRDLFEYDTCHTTNSMRMFTPFKEIPPIATPSKWEIEHVWKAILSGQINSGVLNGIYVDDYFFQGSADVTLPSLACKIIESPYEWSVHPQKSSNKYIELAVSCGEFDLNALYFNPKFEEKSIDE